MSPDNDDSRPGGAVDLVFLHGIDGNAFKAWSADEFHLGNCWPRWIAKRNATWRVWLLGYPAESSRLLGRVNYSLSNVADHVIDVVGKIVGNRPLVLVGHSLGGLVAKQVVVRAQRNAGDAHLKVRDSLRGLAFIATPHAGSGLADLAHRLRKVYRPSPLLEALRRDRPNLAELQGEFRGLVGSSKLLLKAYRESVATKGLMVVDQKSSDPGIPNVPVIEVVCKNHIDISKCESEADPVYQGVLELSNQAIACWRPGAPERPADG